MRKCVLTFPYFYRILKTKPTKSVNLTLNMESLKEIIQFMQPEVRLDLKAVSVSHVLSLTGSVDGRELLYQCPDVIIALIKLTADEAETVAKDSLLAIVNISADVKGATILLETAPNFVQECVKHIMDENCLLADPWTMALCNISRPESLIEQVLNDVLAEEFRLEKLVGCFTIIDYNKRKCSLDYLGPTFSNFSQSIRGRESFCTNETKLLQRILPFVHHQQSLIRRGGAIGILKNICFDSHRHQWLLSDDVDILPVILLPLAGPEEFTDEENDKFPIDLQYLGADKKREVDPDLRKMLLESLAQLCATRSTRDYLRSKGTYEILREHHKWECASETGDPSALAACENVVDILIRTENEIGEDNLKEIDIPIDVIEKLNKMDTNIVDDGGPILKTLRKYAMKCVLSKFAFYSIFPNKNHSEICDWF